MSQNGVLSAVINVFTASPAYDPAVNIVPVFAVVSYAKPVFTLLVSHPMRDAQTNRQR